MVVAHLARRSWPFHSFLLFSTQWARRRCDTSLAVAISSVPIATIGSRWARGAVLLQMGLLGIPLCTSAPQSRHHSESHAFVTYYRGYYIMWVLGLVLHRISKKSTLVPFQTPLQMLFNLGAAPSYAQLSQNGSGVLFCGVHNYSCHTNYLHTFLTGSVQQRHVFGDLVFDSIKC